MRPASCPCSAATVQCSIRIASPSARGCGHDTMSPAPRMSGSPTAVSVASHSSPGFNCRPLPASHSVFGSAPSPKTTRSAATREPSVSSTASTRAAPCSAATPVPRRRSTPWSRCSAAHHSPSSGPSGSIGVGAMSISVTSRPCLRAVWATSHPMNPAPTIATRGRCSSAARSAIPSSRLRRTWTPSSSPPAPGQRRALDPVARISRSYGTSSPSASTTRRRARSRLVADTPRRHCASSVSQGRWTLSTSCSPASTSFDSGGRVYGRWGSSPTITRSPSNPAARAACAARSPASDAPTMTTQRNWSAPLKVDKLNSVL